jgi:hypothetical protein
MSGNTQNTGDQPYTHNQDKKTPHTPAKRTSGYGVILALAIVAIGFIAYFQWQKSPVRPEPPPPKPTVDYAALLQVHADQASRRNVNALKVFEMDVNRVLKEHAAKMVSTAREAAKEAADYGSCSKIVYYLAWDKVKKQNETEAYLNREIKPFVDPAIQALGKDVDTAGKKLDYELRRSTVQLANNLAALGPSDAGPALTVDVDEMSRLDIQQSLRNLGFNAAGIGVSVAFDAVAISKSQLVAVLWKKTTSIATRMFGKQVATLAGSAAVAAVDGPLPVGDIIALGGMIWTGYDIYASQKEFEKEINTSLDNLLAEAQHSVHKQAVEHATAMVKEYQKLQDEIGSQTFDRIAKGNN